MLTDVILDVDTGVDDALALLLATRSPQLNVLAVTCVGGNVPLDRVVTNTLNVLEAAGHPEVPVAIGATGPLREDLKHAQGFHGTDGLGGVDLPQATRRPEPEPAVDFLRRTLLEADRPVTLVPLAPMTNIAQLLESHPEVHDRIRRIVFMGGAIASGNASATAEFNVRQDPEAAGIVINSGISTVMYGLEVFGQVRIAREQADALLQTDRPAAQLAARILLAQMNRFERDHAGLGDAGCVASVIAPDGLTTAEYPVHVELEGTHTRGQTVVDRRPHLTTQLEERWHPPIESRIHVAHDVDAQRYAKLFVETVVR